ncbi:MAG: enoyl-CoA hydratase/isomerase family protein [Acidobacteriota bacterium]
MIPALEYMTYAAVESAGVITLNNPASLNALHRAMIGELGRLFEALKLEKNLRAVIIRGEGKAFAAGADIRQMQTMTPEDARAYSALGNRVFDQIEQFPLPVIAAVHGYALGGGLELMMSCDLAFAAGTAKFGLPELTLGVIPGFGGSSRLARRIGMARAKELIYTGRLIPADDALRMGLVDRVTAADDLTGQTMALVHEMKKVSLHALKTVKKLLNASRDTPATELTIIESQEFGAAFGHPDAKEGMAAFIAKTTPVWNE